MALRELLLAHDCAPSVDYAALAAAIEQAAEGVVITDAGGAIEYVNPAFTRMTGYGAAEALGRNPRLLKSGRQDPGFYRDLWTTIRGGRVWHGQLINRRKDGTFYNEEMTIAPVRDARGVTTSYIAIKQDVTERIRSEQAIRESEEKYRRLVANIPDVIWTADEQGRPVFVSPNIEATCGYTPLEICESGVWFDRIHPEDARLVQQAYAEMLATGKQFSTEYRIQRKDGEWIWLHAKAMNSYVRDGRRYTVGIASDITGRKRIEQALLEGEQKYRSLISNIPDATWVVDAEGNVLFANVSPNIERLLGHNADELYRHGTRVWFDSLHPEDAPRVRQALEALFVQGQPYDVECRVRSKTGEWVWMHDRAVLTQERDGRMCAHGLLSDITARKRAEEARRASDERYRRLFDRNLAGVFRTAWDGRFLDCNPALARAMGYGSREEMLSLGLSASDLYFCAEDREAFLREIKARKGVLNYEMKLRRRDGSAMWALASVSLVEDEQDNAPVLEGTLVDISGRKRAEEELKNAKEAAEAANRAKSEFLANMSHEIRTPMNGVIGMTQLVLDTELTAEQREYLGLARMSAEALLEIINDILDFSKIEARKVEIERARFDLRDTIDGVIKTLAIRAHEKRLELTCRIAPDVPAQVMGDAGRLRQVLLNLVGNAIKFTDRGQVAVQAGREAGQLHLSIRDTGVGIPADKRTSIFEAFSQADTSITRRFGGTGLGLTISSQLIGLMGGRIWVESDPGRGSTFHFTVPLELAERGGFEPPVEL